MSGEAVYEVAIVDVACRISRNCTMFIDLIAETSDAEKIVARYYFTDKSKYYSYKELTKLLKDFYIFYDDDNILDGLMQLKGKEVYFIETPLKNYVYSYHVLKDIKDINNI